MFKARTQPLAIVIACAAAAAGMPRPAAGQPIAKSADSIDFGRDIRPILANNCFKCHGPDDAARQAGLRLDTREGATTASKPGQPAPITPGDPDASELMRRIMSDDPDEKMPPPEVNPRGLSPDKIELLGRWIKQGAPWGEHWAFVPVTSPSEPSVTNMAWPKAPMDRFVLARLEAESLSTSIGASKETLLRRVSLDLIGLPPTPQEREAFLADESADAYERVVDRLLASPRYGEKWARWWLDLARYADTKGYEKDDRRTIWPYRDWVIKAFNTDEPLNEFTIDQLAGDLRDRPSTDQIVATAFHRNTMTNDEGGTDDEEFRVAAVIDRVNTTMEVWQGLTFGCAQCHSHKYDPITQTDYYRLFAVFNNTQDSDKADESPTFALGSGDAQRRIEELDRIINDANMAIDREVAGLAEESPPAEPPSDVISVVDDHLPGAVEVYVDDAIRPWPWSTPAVRKELGLPEGPKAFRGTRCWHTGGDGVAQTFFHKLDPALAIGVGGELSVSVYLDPAAPPKGIMLQWISVEDTWSHRAYWGDASAIPWAKEDEGSAKRRRVGDLPTAGEWVRLTVPASVVNLENHSITGWAFAQSGGSVYWDAASVRANSPQKSNDYVRSLATWIEFERARDAVTLPAPLRAALKGKDPTDAEMTALRAYYLRYVNPVTVARVSVKENLIAAAGEQRRSLARNATELPVMRELVGDKKRTTRRFNRGSFLSPAEEVQPGIPGFLSQVSPARVENRLDLARWLMADSNPLTARVLANRVWEQVFGSGIVETVEDFGTQGAWPTNRDLLDQLAITLRDECRWSLKAFLRTIVTSATYRQASAASAQLIALDPGDRLLARFPRVRLDGEMIRDSALAASGLLSGKMFGPSVFPHQPEGVWQMIYNDDAWRQSEVEDAHRRSVYTFWRRTSPHPAMTTFDAPSREFCVSRRIRTNTPLQSFVTLNDPQFVECAEALANKAAQAGNDPGSRLAAAFLRVLCREPTRMEQEELVRAFEAQRRLGASDHAALVRVCSVILNLDESLTKE